MDRFQQSLAVSIVLASALVIPFDGRGTRAAGADAPQNTQVLGYAQALKAENILAHPTRIISIRLGPGGGWLAGVPDPDSDSTNRT